MAHSTHVLDECSFNAKFRSSIAKSSTSRNCSIARGNDHRAILAAKAARLQA